MSFDRETRGRQRYRFLDSILAGVPRLTRKSSIPFGAALLIVLIAFLAGSWLGQRRLPTRGRRAARSFTTWTP